MGPTAATLAPSTHSNPAAPALRAAALPLFRLGFCAFVAWLCILPSAARFASPAVYAGFAWVAASFVAALALFSLLAHTNRLPKTAASALLPSVAATALGLAFLLASAPQLRLVALCALMVCAACLLVVWARALRGLVASDAFALVVQALLCAGAVRVAACAPQVLLGQALNPGFHYLAVLALLSAFPLVSGVAFMLCRGEAPRPSGTAGSQRAHDPAAAPPAPALPYAPLVPLLFVASVLATAFTGFVYSPFMFNQAQLDVCQGIVLLAAAAAVLGLFRRGEQTALPFAVFVSRLLCALLLATVGALLLALFMPTGVFASQAVLGALGDMLVMLIVFFALNKMLPLRRAAQSAGSFLHLFAAVACSGMLWAPALGAAVQGIVGYDAFAIGVAATVFIVAIAALTLLVLLAARPHGQPASAQHHAPSRQAHHTAGPAPAPVPPSVSPAAAVLPRPAPGPAAATTASHQEAYARASRVCISNACRIGLSPYGLSRRELQVAQLMLEGLTAQAVAARLGISLNTVRGYTKDLYRKCGVNSKALLIGLIMGEASAQESQSHELV